MRGASVLQLHASKQERCGLEEFYGGRWTLVEAHWLKKQI